MRKMSPGVGCFSQNFHFLVKITFAPGTVRPEPQKDYEVGFDGWAIR